MTHDDLEAVLLLLGVGAVDVAAEGCLNAGPIFVVLLEDGREVERHLRHKKRGLQQNPRRHCTADTWFALHTVGNV